MSRAALSSVHLVENSLSMQDIQKNKLLPASEKGVWDLVWHDALDDVPQGTDEYTMLVAHEFFDALPINVLEASTSSIDILRVIIDIILYDRELSMDGTRSSYLIPQIP